MDAKTVKTSASRVVLVVAAPPAFVDVCRVAALVAGARTLTSDLASAATEAAKHRPFAIVLPPELYEFDRSEFDALARDVLAKVIVASGRSPGEELEKRILAAWNARALQAET